MKNKSGKSMRGPTLEIVELIPITDPVRQAQIDRQRRQIKQGSSRLGRNGGKRKSAKHD